MRKSFVATAALVVLAGGVVGAAIVAVNDSFSATKTGLSIGAGIEGAARERWTGKFEHHKGRDRRPPRPPASKRG